jgi:hypothetical protein
MTLQYRKVLILWHFKTTNCRQYMDNTFLQSPSSIENWFMVAEGESGCCAVTLLHNPLLDQFSHQDRTFVDQSVTRSEL